MKNLFRLLVIPILFMSLQSNAAYAELHLTGARVAPVIKETPVNAYDDFRVIMEATRNCYTAITFYGPYNMAVATEQLAVPERHYNGWDSKKVYHNGYVCYVKQIAIISNTKYWPHEPRVYNVMD